MESVQGELEYEITYRRPEGQVIETRHLRGRWADDVNAYRTEEKLARLRGRAVGQLDGKLIQEVREGQEVVASSAPPTFPTDAPLNVLR
jgi:hypothetical protein